MLAHGCFVGLEGFRWSDPDMASETLPAYMVTPWCEPCLDLSCFLRSQAKYVDPEKALEAKERGNEQFRAGQWALAISEYEEVSKNVVGCDKSQLRTWA